MHWFHDGGPGSFGPAPIVGHLAAFLKGWPVWLPACAAALSLMALLFVLYRQSLGKKVVARLATCSACTSKKLWRLFGALDITIQYSYEVNGKTYHQKETWTWVPPDLTINARTIVKQLMKWPQLPARYDKLRPDLCRIEKRFVWACLSALNNSQESTEAAV